MGASFMSEQVDNTFITDSAFRIFPLKRNEGGFYWENWVQLARRLFVNAGLRADVIGTREIAADPTSGRPRLPSDSIVKVNPKVALAYAVRPAAQFHSSFSTGIRPPGGFDLAFTNNRLKPEWTISFDAGIEHRLAADRLALNGQLLLQPL
jgi:outer membrane receptor protein involved in Fe transport